MSEASSPNMSIPTKKRAIVYIDGFNLYKGVLSGHPARKWLDLVAYFSTIRPKEDVRRIYFFTSYLNKANQEEKLRQRLYLNALQAYPTVKTILGNFEVRPEKCRVQHCSYAGEREFDRDREKRTDVNLSVQMMNDAYQNHADVFILVSGDSDFVGVVKAVRSLEKQVIVYIPGNKYGRLSELARTVELKALSIPELEASQLPNIVTLTSGKQIRRPLEWN
jgi:uncharacterized LabA/DUF88 family protein